MAYLQKDMKLEGVSRDAPGGASARANSHWVTRPPCRPVP